MSPSLRSTRQYAVADDGGCSVALNYSLLGPLAVRLNGAPVLIPGARRRALLTRLLIDANRIVPADRLIEDLWGGAVPEHPSNALQAYVSHLRRVLEPGAGTELAPFTVLVTRKPGYMLAVEADDLDAILFSRSFSDGRAALSEGRPAQAADILAEALELWRGPAMAEFAHFPWAAAEVARLDQLHWAAVEESLAAGLALGRNAAVAAAAEKAVTEQPFREGLWAHLMLALYRSGRQAEGLRAYTELARVLSDELGISPSPRLARLEADILLQSSDLDLRLPQANLASGPARSAGKPAADVVATHLMSDKDAPGNETRVVAPKGRRINLPLPVSSFVGRHEEMTALAKTLGSTRLLTLTGAGGCGKTRLAVALGSRVAGDFEDGIYFADLAPLAIGGRVADALMSALGLRERQGADAGAVIEQHLEQRDALLVVDNCEHLLAEAATLIRRLLETSPGLKVVATSREPLGVHGETRWNVPPMSEPEAEALFLERLSESRGQGALAKGELAAVIRICCAVDRLPLAVELAAALGGLLGLSDLESRLDGLLGFHASYRGESRDRHETMEAAIDWGYALLETAERTVLQQLSVFAGGWDLAGAEAVCGVDAIGHIVGLLRKSFAQSDLGAVPARYRLLAPIQHYARNRLAGSGNETQARTRHLAWFLQLAEDLVPMTEGSDAPAARDRLEFDLDNFRTALDWALRSSLVEDGLRLVHALFPIWVPDVEVPTIAGLGIHGGRYREGLEWSEAMLALPGPATCIRSAVTRRAGLLASQLGHSALSDRLIELAVDIARASGDSCHLGRALCTRAYPALRSGDLNGARNRLLEGLAILEKVGDEEFVTDNSLLLATVARRQGRYNEAKAIAHKIVEHAARRNHYYHACALATLANIAEHEGDYRASEAFLHDLREVSVVLGRSNFEVAALGQLARLALLDCRVADARVWSDAMMVALDNPDGNLRPLIAGGIGWLAAAEGDYLDGILLLTDATNQARARADNDELGYLLIPLGAALLRLGDWREAQTAYGEALELGELAGNPGDQANAIDGLAAGMAIRGAAGDARPLLARSDTLRRESGAALPPAWEWVAAIARRGVR